MVTISTTYFIYLRCVYMAGGDSPPLITFMFCFPVLPDDLLRGKQLPAHLPPSFRSGLLPENWTIQNERILLR